MSEEALKIILSVKVFLMETRDKLNRKNHEMHKFQPLSLSCVLCFNCKRSLHIIGIFIKLIERNSYLCLSVSTTLNNTTQWNTMQFNTAQYNNLLKGGGVITYCSIITHDRENQRNKHTRE